MLSHATMRGMDPEKDLVGRWRDLLTSYSQIASHLDRELQESHGLTMSEFETLDRLVEVGCTKCRMQDLLSHMYLSQSALSRTVARLEKHGLVERALCQDDRRGVFVRITEAGRQRHTEAHRTHTEILSQHLNAPLPA